MKLEFSQLSKLPNFYIKKAVPSKILLSTLSNLKCSIIIFLNMFARSEVCTSKLATVVRNLAIGLFFEKPITLKHPTPPTVFAEHPSNFAQNLTTKLRRASRTRIFEFASRFFRTTQSQNFIEKSTLKKFWKILNFFRVGRGWKSKIRLLEALRNLVLSVCANFEEYATKL